jgi:hypothetical protein
VASASPSLNELVASLAKHAEVLGASALMKAPEEVRRQDVPVREMLQRASDLVRGAAALGEQCNPGALGVLARATLENLILLLWVQVDEKNAAELNEASLSELARIARINLEKGKARILNRETGEDATAEFLGSDRFKNLKKRTSVETRANEAGVEDLYTVFYRFMSLDMHGLGLSQPGQSRETMAIIQMQGIGALALASGHVGVKWLIHRTRTDNETLRELLGIGRRPDSSSTS